MIINAGLSKIVIRRTPSTYDILNVQDWVFHDDSVIDPSESGEQGITNLLLQSERSAAAFCYVTGIKHPVVSSLSAPATRFPGGRRHCDP